MSKHTPKEIGCYTIYPDARIESKSAWRGTETRFLTTFPNEDGYHFVRLVLNGKRKKWLVHSLMAELFLGAKPGLGFQIRHLNGDRADNRIENLKWGTAKENANDREIHGRTCRGRQHRTQIKKAIELSKINARLITAAPEMLEALKDLFQAIQGDPAEMYRLDTEFQGACSSALRKANLAIAKAEGRE